MLLFYFLQKYYNSEKIANYGRQKEPKITNPSFPKLRTKMGE